MTTPGKLIVFEGPEDYHDRIEDPALGIDEHCVLVIRNCGPVGYPGAAETCAVGGWPEPLGDRVAGGAGHSPGSLSNGLQGSNAARKVDP